MSTIVWVFAIWLVLAILYFFIDIGNQGEDTGAKLSRDVIIIGLIIYILSLLI